MKTLLPLVSEVYEASRPEDGIAVASEKFLIDRAKAGDLRSFHTLYLQYVDRIYGLCWRLSGDRFSAEELTQETFIQVWKALRRFRGHSAFSTWLHRIAVNVALSERRRELRRLPHALEGGEGRQVSEAPADPGVSFDLERAITSLPDGARQVFVLHDVEGYKHEEVAALCHMAVGTSKAQLHRARRLLRERLSL